LTRLIVELPASIKASAAASRILQQAQEMLAPPETGAEQQPTGQQQFAESHLLHYRIGLFSGRCQVENVDASDNLTDVWFNSNNLLVLLLPSPPGSSSAPGGSNRRAKAGSKRVRQEEGDEEQQGDDVEYMLVFNSTLDNHTVEQLPVLLPMASGEEGLSKDEAVTASVQVRCWRAGRCVCVCHNACVCVCVCVCVFEGDLAK
jgi:hypothetical protein